MDSERACVCILAAILIDLRLMHDDFVLLYCTLFWHHRNVMEFVCLYAAVAFSPFLDEGKEQRQSCVFPRNAMLSSPPSFLICVLLQVRVLSFMYIRGACALWSERQYCDQGVYSVVSLLHLHSAYSISVEHTNYTNCVGGT